MDYGRRIVKRKIFGILYFPIIKSRVTTTTQPHGYCIWSDDGGVYHMHDNAADVDDNDRKRLWILIFLSVSSFTDWTLFARCSQLMNAGRWATSPNVFISNRKRCPLYTQSTRYSWRNLLRMSVCERLKQVEDNHLFELRRDDDYVWILFFASFTSFLFKFWSRLEYTTRNTWEDHTCSFDEKIQWNLNLSFFDHKSSSELCVKKYSRIHTSI